MYFQKLIPIASLALGIATGSFTAAQTMTDFRQPGDIIRLEIVFDGPDAEKIRHASVILGAISLLPGQGGLSSSFGSDGKRLGPADFEFDIPIRPDVASGRYGFRVLAGPSHEINKEITIPDRFKNLTYTIRNDEHFLVGIKDIKLAHDPVR